MLTASAVAVCHAQAPHSPHPVMPASVSTLTSIQRDAQRIGVTLVIFILLPP